MSDHPPLRSRAPAISTDRLIRVQTTCLLVIAGAITAAGLYLLQPVMIPLALALLFSYTLAPFVEVLTDRLRLPRVLSIALAVAMVAGLLAAIGILVGSSLGQVLESGDAYEKALIRFGRDIGLPISAHDLAVDPRVVAEGGLKAEVLERAADMPVGRWASSLADGLLGMVGTLSLVMVFTLFMLASDSHPEFWSLRARVARRVKRYLAIKFVLSLITGALVGVVLAVLGLELALLLGVLTFALNFVPNIGPLVAMALPVPLVIVQSGAGMTLALAIAVPAVIQFVIGAIIEPRFLGSELRLHPVSVLAALVFWGMLWGIPGLLLAVPLTTAVHIAAGSTELTRPIADLLSGRFLHPDAPEPPPTEPPRPALRPRRSIGASPG